MKKIPFFFLAVTLVILSLNLTPLVLQTWHAPPGTVFASIHNNVQDYFFYLSLMNEGANGNWLTYDPFTTEPHNPSFVFTYFLWLGKFSALFNIPTHIIYHSSRVIFGFLLFAAAWKLFSLLRVPYRKLCFLFFVFSSPLMRNYHDGGKIVITPFMHWWTGMNPLRRAAYLPHHMLGGFLLVLTIIFLIRFKREGGRKNLVLSIVFSAMLSYILTPSLFLLLISLPVAIVIYYLVRFLSDHRLPKILNDSFLAGIFLFFVVSIAGMFLMIAQTSLGFPWSQYIAWERNLQFPVQAEILGALGILVPLAFLGVVKAVVSRNFGYILMASLFTVPILFIPLAPKVGMSNIRIIQGLPHLPLSVLSVLGLSFLQQIIGILLRKFQILNFKFLFNLKLISNFKFQILNYALPFFILVVFFIFTFPTILWSVNDQIAEYWPLYGNVYLDKRLFDSFRYINANFPGKSRVLATFYSGNMLPAYTHTITYAGHFGYTMNYQKKNSDLADFFSEKMSVEQAKSLLKNNRIDFVFQGPEEKGLLDRKIYPDLLEVVYDQIPVTIYRIR